MKNCLVEVQEGLFVNPSQVCYVRSRPLIPTLSFIGFHGGTRTFDEMDNDCYTNELMVRRPVGEVVQVLEHGVAL